MAKKIKWSLVGLVAAVMIALPYLGVNNYLLQVLITTITYAILGLAFGFTLKVGLPRFDIAAWWAVGAYTSAELMQKAHWPFWPTILAAGLVAVVLGYLVYSIALPRGMMVFLLFGMVLVLAVYQLVGSVKFFGGWGGTGILPRVTLGDFVFTSRASLYYMGLFFIGINLVVYYLLYNSRIGRAWNAIGSSLKLASSVGVDVVRYRMVNVLIGNFFLAIAGAYVVACNQLANPAIFSFGASVNVMMYVIVGGVRFNLIGPMVGALVITFVPEYLRAARQWQPVFTSVATILIIEFLPNGLLGLIEKQVWPFLKRNKWLARMLGKSPAEPRLPA
jgi:branched-chain amino acid transport system permease protein